MGAGCERLLLEKPRALHFSELAALHTPAQSAGAKVWVTYNYWFYATAQKLRKLTVADGGITSVHLNSPSGTNAFAI